MNPSIYPSVVPSDTWDKIIQHEFMPATGIEKRKLFGGAICLKGKPVYHPISLLALNKKMRVFNRAECKRRVDLKIEERMTPKQEEEALKGKTVDTAPIPTTLEEKESAGFPTWAKWTLIGGGTLLLIGGIIYFVRAGKAGKMQTVPARTPMRGR